ncbi:unnamed protein product [Arabidopsis thaliana]|uniref:Uncharacterized protein n=1 Tax=Arabidopsis thaliana TaxID=3702 RepID=A0A5S9YGX2_ARATH|nr:unnamed protein product [Arabidopsis thaliana]
MGQKLVFDQFSNFKAGKTIWGSQSNDSKRFVRTSYYAYSIQQYRCCNHRLPYAWFEWCSAKKKRIDEEFGNLPVIDLYRNIEHEELFRRALCFMHKPISRRDLNSLNVVCQQALRHRMNGQNVTDDPDDWLRLREKPKLKWTKPLQHRFMSALKSLGVASKY